MLASSLSGQSIVTESIESGLDRKHLLELQRRFLGLNQQRLQRTHSALSHRQQVFLEALPLLFHVNHPLLPGYMGKITPFGVCEYKPSKHEVQLGRSFARSFRYQHNLQLNPQNMPVIESLFLMGSLGTVAHSRASDLDIWVCHAASLSRDRLLLLKQKCRALSDAAKNISLDCHFFLMNADNFRQGISQSLSNEASGSTQHLLLLDEFYRTALWLAGRTPLWWLVPAAREQNYHDYRHKLLSKRFVQEKKIIDFGPVPEIPPEEFAGAALWQLYKAIEAPYKSVFKLLLLEAYTCAYPGFQPLSLSFKQRVYDSEVDVDELDAYIVAYRRIEHYLQNRNEPTRLELVRRCLYLKINKPLSKKFRDSSTSWQRQLLEKLVDEWQWSCEKIEELDQRRLWKADRVLRERNLLVAELLSSYKSLRAFKQRHQAVSNIDRDEFNTLGHKLYASYERRPGKIDWINPGIASDLSESNLCFVEDRLQDKSRTEAGLGAFSWRVYAQSKTELDNSANWQQLCPMPLKHGALMELVLWCHCNGLLAAGSRCEFVSGEDEQPHGGNTAQLYPLIRAIQQWLPVPLPEVSHNHFKQRAFVTHLFIHVNLGREPDKALHEKGLYHVSDIDDAFGYGELKHNLVKSIDLVSRNSWNEIETQHFENDGANLLNNNALALCLRNCLQVCLTSDTRQHQLPDIRVHCGNSACGNTIRYRVDSLLRDVLNCYASDKLPLSTRRYLFAMEKGFYACQCRAVSEQRVQARLEALDSEASVEDYLSRSQTHHSPIVFDRYCQIDDGLRLIAKVSDSRAINIAFQTRSKAAELIMLDEQGSLYRGWVPYHNDTTLLRSLHYFLRSVIRRQSALGGDFKADFDVFPIRFYRLQHRGEQAFLEPCHSSSELSQLLCYPVEVSAHNDALGKEQLTLRCNQQEYNQGRLGEQFFQRVREQIIRPGPNGERYPCYITDLDLSGYHLPGLSAERWQTSHYLRFKVELETRLNAF